ncbi:Mbov_0401 family ICE element transposase-like protein [Spiroplasma endosymbiont of Amphimallon solstitiale]|uniref:Mbov_0401 family ICE element transposase-like protein n=1 Tax=Spiroplasma endosymbiont of Amphimallon solstitiale TaxID=3066288 RepID=UPI003CC7AA5A
MIKSNFKSSWWLFLFYHYFSTKLKEQYAKIDKLVLEHLKNKWEKRDWIIKNTRDKKKYKIVDYQYRTRKTIYGLVTYKRRIYKYFDEKLQKWIRVCLVDEWLELPKYKRIGKDIEQTIIEYFADGKRYRDIWDVIKKANISLSTIHRVFNNLEVIETIPVKVKLEKNQPIFIAIDDGHRKFWNFKRKGIKHSMRLITTYTDNINHKLQNKRVKAIIRPTKTAIGVKKTAEFIKEHCQKFYENVEQAKIIICGDSAGWIKDVADYLGAEFVLDKFHLIRTLYLGIMAGNKGKYWSEYNNCKNLIKNGQYDELIDYLYNQLDNHKKLKKQYFKNNKKGIVNQGASWNIGCFTETNIWHVLKEMIANRTYNILIYIKMVIFKCNKINLET